MSDTDLVARLTEWLADMELWASDPSASFERDAERFYRATGYMAPGKSVPLEMTSTANERERKAAHEAWADARRQEKFTLVREAIAALTAQEGEREVPDPPEPPPHWDNAQLSAWESGWRNGWANGYAAALSALEQQRAGWEEEARLAHQNVNYWRQRAEATPTGEGPQEGHGLCVSRICVDCGQTVGPLEAWQHYDATRRVVTVPLCKGCFDQRELAAPSTPQGEAGTKKAGITDGSDPGLDNRRWAAVLSAFENGVGASRGRLYRSELVRAASGGGYPRVYHGFPPSPTQPIRTSPRRAARNLRGAEWPCWPDLRERPATSTEPRRRAGTVTAPRPAPMRAPVRRCDSRGANARKENGAVRGRGRAGEGGDGMSEAAAEDSQG